MGARRTGWRGRRFSTSRACASGSAATSRKVATVEPRECGYYPQPVLETQIRVRHELASRPWRGETGYINAGMLTRFIDDLKSPVYYAAGPEGLVTAMRKTLAEAGVSEADVRAEEFSGY